MARQFIDESVKDNRCTNGWPRAVWRAKKRWVRRGECEEPKKKDPPERVFRYNLKRVAGSEELLLHFFGSGFDLLGASGDGVGSTGDGVGGTSSSGIASGGSGVGSGGTSSSGSVASGSGGIGSGVASGGSGVASGGSGITSGGSGITSGFGGFGGGFGGRVGGFFGLVASRQSEDAGGEEYVKLRVHAFLQRSCLR
jgi:hypothetical protein